MSLFDSYSEAAKALVQDSVEEARSLGHNYVGTEHLLLAYLGREDASGPLARRGVTRERAAEVAKAKARWPSDDEALAAVGIDLQRLKASLQRLGGEAAIRPSAPAPTAGEVRFTPRVKTVLELAVTLPGVVVVEPVDVLRAILAEDGGLAVIVLEHLGVEPEELAHDLGPSK